MSSRAVTTREIDLGRPAGLPQPRPREVLSEITSITSIRINKTKRLAQVGGIAAAALLLMALILTGNNETEMPAPKAPPPTAAAPALAPMQAAKTSLGAPNENEVPAAADKLPENDNNLFEVSVSSRPLPKNEPKNEAETAAVAETKAETLSTKPATDDVSGFGMVELTTDPRVVVYDGDRRLGRTPLKTKLSYGTHELRFVSRKLRLEEKRHIRVKAAETSKSIYFGVSKLRLDGPEGAKVYLDGRYAGELPLETIKLAEGRHRLKVTHDGTVHTEMLNIPPSRTIDYRMTF